MDSKYDHSLVEDKIYQHWESHGYFNPDTNGRGENKQPFTIIMPPPNANDPLHVGHAMFATIEDILIRYHRMKGDDTLWQPGVDHAGIETQFVFEKKLAKKGQSRFQFDRDTLYSMIWDYVHENADVATSQLKKIGSSADWSRFKFTLNPEIIQTVLETFTQLFEADLVYRDLKLVNYCPKCGTAFSDLEVDHVPATTPLYYLKYGPFTLATTRPETIFGDVAVAIHPDDQRYQKYVGQTIEVQGVNNPFKVKVITDDYVDPEFGTGVVKITPFHDHNDFAVWQRHKDELPPPQQVIGFDGRLLAPAGPFAGLKVQAAREAIVAKMTELGLIDSVDNNYQNTLATCYRCHSTLEPLPLAQFFIKTEPLTAPIIEKINQGQLKVHGAGHDKILLNWLTKLHDWNISRQIVWGIQQPIWYDTQTQASQLNLTFISKNKDKVTGNLQELFDQGYQLEEIKAGLQSLNADLQAEFVVSLDQPSPHHLQETDTFDTWFSSAQWPFATLLNNQPGDFERFYPTQVMETGYDILPFWVMRMLMIGQFKTDQLPFDQVYLHGLIRDAKGQKMSKSKGNVINPLDIVEKYGADALRMALVIRSTPGLDKSVGEPDFRAMRNLTNKIWNAARFILMQTESPFPPKPKADSDQLIDDQELTQHLNALITNTSQQLEKLQIGLAADRLYDSFWHFFCDQAIESHKKGSLSLNSLTAALLRYLQLLHPFIPFVTEQIWQELALIRKDFDFAQNDLIVSHWPTT